MRITPLLAALFGAGTAWAWAHTHSRHHQQRRLHKPRAKPPAVTTWEGEGGALPVSGAQIGPEPKLP